MHLQRKFFSYISNTSQQFGIKIQKQSGCPLIIDEVNTKIVASFHNKFSYYTT